jgi:hypothetical protein
MASNKSTDGRVTAFTLLFAFAVVLAAYLSGPENNFWMAPGAIMYMILLLAIAIPRWPAVGDDTKLTKNLAVIITLLSVPSILAPVFGIKTSTNVYNYWRSIMIPLYLGYSFMKRNMPGSSILITFSTPLILMLSMIFSINPLPNAIKIPGTNVANE